MQVAVGMRVAVGLLVATLNGPAVAQENGWSFALSPYLWTPGISSSVGTQFGTLDANASVGDVLSATKFAAMGSFEARKGNWGLIADFLYSDLEERGETPFGVLFSRARIDTELTMLGGYAAYRLYEDGRVALDAMGGIRATWLNIGVSLSPGALPGQNFSTDESWVDPLIGVRARIALSHRWIAMALADIGGFGAGSDLTWQVLASLGYQFNERWSVQGGWRHLSTKKDLGGRDIKLELGGPFLGVTVRF